MNRTQQLLMTITAVLFCTAVYAQPTFDWGVSYGGTSLEYGASVASDNAGNVYVGGTIFSSTIDIDPGTATKNLTINGSTDGYISKFDKNGNFLWVLHINGPNSDYCLMVTTDASGNVYAIGSFSGTVDFDPGPGTANVTANSIGDAFIVKLGASGNLIWVKQLGAIGTTAARGIAVDNNGNVLITGQYSSTTDFDPGPAVSNLTSAGSSDGFALKLDANGSFLWARSLGGTSADYGHDIDQAGSNGIIVVGEFQGTADFDPGSGTFNLTSNGMRDGFAVMLDTSGNFMWAAQIGAGSNDRIFKSDADQNGNVYLVGNFRGSVDFDPGPGTYLLSGSGDDGFLLKLNASGKLKWAFDIGASSVNDFTYDVNVSPSSDVLIVGTFENTIDIDPGPAVKNMVSTGLDDGYLAKYDTSGNLIFAQQFTGTSNQEPYSVFTNNSGATVVSGHHAFTSDIDPTAGVFNVTSNGNMDAFVVRLKECVNTISTFSASDCSSYTVPSGDETYTTIGSYQVKDTILNGCGKDSIMTINLTITGPSNGTDVLTACDSLQWIDGKTYYASNSTATHTLTGGAYNGCDSIVTLNLTIVNATTGTDKITACNAYKWIDGKTYTSSNNTATYTIAGGAANGCDSIVTLNLTINTVNTTTAGNDTITASATGATYQWLDCDNNYAVISGATNQMFIATANGHYAVAVTQNGCTDTSACVTVTGVGIDENTLGASVKVYPNPTTGIIHIDPGKLTGTISVKISSIEGKTVYQGALKNGKVTNIMLDGEAGIYIVEIRSNTGNSSKHSIIKN